jgi:hypothetical protein
MTDGSRRVRPFCCRDPSGVMSRILSASYWLGGAVFDKRDSKSCQ